MKALENIRLKKAEEAKKMLDQKLKEQEHKYTQMISDLQAQVEALKANQSIASKNERNPSAGNFKRRGSISEMTKSSDIKPNSTQGINSFNQFRYAIYE